MDLEVNTNFRRMIFKDLAYRPNISISRDVHMFVWMYIVSSVNDRNQESWRLLVKESIVNIAKLRTPFFEHFNVFYVSKKLNSGVAGGASVAMAVDFRDIWHYTFEMWQVTGDTWQVTHDRWHMTGETRRMTCDT